MDQYVHHMQPMLGLFTPACRNTCAHWQIWTVVIRVGVSESGEKEKEAKKKSITPNFKVKASTVTPDIPTVTDSILNTLSTHNLLSCVADVSGVECYSRQADLTCCFMRQEVPGDSNIMQATLLPM